MDGIQISPTADVDSTAQLGPGTTVWHLAQIRENAQARTTVHRRQGSLRGARRDHR